MIQKNDQRRSVVVASGFARASSSARTLFVFLALIVCMLAVVMYRRVAETGLRLESARMVTTNSSFFLHCVLANRGNKAIKVYAEKGIPNWYLMEELNNAEIPVKQWNVDEADVALLQPGATIPFRAEIPRLGHSYRLGFVMKPPSEREFTLLDKISLRLRGYAVEIPPYSEILFYASTGGLERVQYKVKM
jgi:hypothetical protein